MLVAKSCGWLEKGVCDESGRKLDRDVDVPVTEFDKTIYTVKDISYESGGNENTSGGSSAKVTTRAGRDYK